MSTMQGDLLGLGQPSSDPSARSPSAGLTLNLASNNPFRNRAASPNSLASPSLGSPFEDPDPPRPTSRNPFLDPDFDSSAPRAVASPEKMADSKPTHSATAEDIFGSLTLDNNTRRPSQPRTASNVSRPPRGPPRGENIPPRGRGPPPGSHRPSRSQEEALRARRMQGGSNGAKPSASPQRSSDQRLRRNSESSVMEKPASEEEKKMRDMRRRDRERRDRNGKPKAKKLDIIDQLDATSIYGTGLFHHDGPFDACNPHRNRKGSRRAPMQAFAKDSANNTIGGSGPLNKRPDHTQFLAHEQHEATMMYAGERASKRAELSLYDPKKADVEHGEETLGLGSSTFLEGTPAAMTAIVRDQKETAQEAAERDAGLGRKKSVVQRFKSIKRGPREHSDGRVASPEAYYTPRPSGVPTGASTNEANPFFAEFDKGGEEQITVRRKNSTAQSPLSPVPALGSTLERRSTTDATMDSPIEGQPKQGGGFMSRVKSLKGGRRQQGRTEPAQPGTAM